MLARVSNIDAFRRWREDEDQSVEDLVRFITVDEPSEAMMAGTAFHKAMETAGDGIHDTFEANGYKFHLIDGNIVLPDIREMRAHRQYGGLLVTGQVDGILGRMVIDHKTTSRCDAERYLDGCQWRFYLDIFGADIFRWYIFEISEVGDHEYRVAAPQILTAYRYPEMSNYCAALAADYLAFAKRYLSPPILMAG